MTEEQTNQPSRAFRRWGARRPSAAAIAGGTALAIGLGAGGYAVAGAATTAGSGATATAASATAATTPPAPSAPKAGLGWSGRVDGPGGPGGIGGPGWIGGPGGIGHHLRGALAGTVTAVGSGSIVVAAPDGTSTTVQVNGSTTYRQDGKTLTLGQIKAGEDVVVAPTSATAQATSPVASSVTVVGPVIAGRVVSVSGSTVVVADAQGFYRTVVTSPSTTVTKAGAAASLSAITTGTQIEALGTIAADHTDLDATAIQVVLPRIAGRVSAVDAAAGTITLTTPGSSGTTTVTTTSATRFVKGTASTTLGAISSGAFVVVTGTPGSGNTFSALEVAVGPAQGAAPKAGFGRGPGGMGPWGHAGRAGMAS